MGINAPVKTLVQEWFQQKVNQEEEVDDIDDVEERKLREMFMDEGLIKKKDKERERKLLYQGVHCVMSLYLFHKENTFRLICYKIYKHKAFDNFIMLLIGLSSVKLAVDSYLTNYGKDSVVTQLSEGIDIFMNICFLIELIIKVIAMGFLMDEGSYIRETWN